MKQKIHLNESELIQLIREVINEVAMTGKSGKTYSLHGNDPKSWAIMHDLRAGSYPFGSSKNDRNKAYDEENYYELMRGDEEDMIDMEKEIEYTTADLM